MGSFDRQAFSQRLVERFTIEVTERLGSSLPRADQLRVVAIAKQALSETINTLDRDEAGPARTLPVTRLKAADVISQGMIDMSQATLYRAADNGRFYGITPSGRSIGKVFPVWQFVEPVPELIAPVLACFAHQTAADIHAFWVSAAAELNELTPAELLAGLPFDTRGQLRRSQEQLLDLPARLRQQKVVEFAMRQSRNPADIVG